MGRMDVGILLYEGFDELDAVGPFEVFQNAGEAGENCRARLLTLDQTEQVTASHGLCVEPDGRLPDPEANAAPDLLTVPGGGWADRSEAGARAEYERGAIPEAIGAYHAAGATVASVCTGGMLLSAAGVLDGRPAVTHASALDALRDTDARVPEADTPTGVPRVVDDGDVVTCGGVTSGIDLALHLVGREFGHAVADRIAHTLEYDRRE